MAVEKLNVILKKFPGKSKLKFIVSDNANKISVEMFSKKCFVDASNEFIKEVGSVVNAGYKLN